MHSLVATKDAIRSIDGRHHACIRDILYVYRGSVLYTIDTVASGGMAAARSKRAVIVHLPMRSDYQ